MNLILERFNEKIVSVIGERQIKVSGPADLKKLEPNTIAFIHDLRFLENLPESQISVLIVNEAHKELAQSKSPQLLLTTNENVVLLRSEICKVFFNFYIPNYGASKIHPTAVIEKSAIIAPNTVIGPHVYVGHDVKIGESTIIQANSVIEDQSKIGQSCRIHPLVYIGAKTQMGDFCEVHSNTSIGSEGFGFAPDHQGQFHRIPHYGCVEIHDHVEIGSNVAIDRGKVENTIIRSGVKIDNDCHIAHNVEIGENGIITAGFIIAGSTTIGKNFVSGGRATVTGHKTLCDNIQLAALSVVLKNIDEPGQYAGYPLQIHKEALRTQSSLTELPKLRKQMKLVLKKLGLD